MRKKKQKYSMSEEQRLLCRWTMELASYLKEELEIDDKTALRKAHLTRNLLRALGEGKVTFSYRKQDGSLRTAHGTLRHGICKEFDEYRYASDEAEDTASEWPYSHFVYWDLDRQGFRSFRAEDLEDYIKDRVTVLKTE